MSPIGGRHAACVREINRLLSKQVDDEQCVDVQSPVRLGEQGEPQPNLAVIRAREYGDSLPTPEDVLFLIEVADTSLAFDRNVKLPMYARAGIAEVWLVDLNEGAIERHTEPSQNGYRLVRRAMTGEILESAALPGLAAPVDTVLS